MTDLLWCATLKGAPRTKKNHQQILRNRSGRPFVAPSKNFLVYQEKCLWQIKTPHRAISEAVNVRCLYYMPDRRRVDLTNLLEATDDILVRAGVLADDCASVVAGHDGSAPGWRSRSREWRTNHESKLFKMRPFPAVERLQSVPGMLQAAVGRVGQ